MSETSRNDVFPLPEYKAINMINNPGISTENVHLIAPIATTKNLSKMLDKASEPTVQEVDVTTVKEFSDSRITHASLSKENVKKSDVPEIISQSVITEADNRTLSENSRFMVSSDERKTHISLLSSSEMPTLSTNVAPESSSVIRRSSIKEDIALDNYLNSQATKADIESSQSSSIMDKDNSSQLVSFVDTDNRSQSVSIIDTDKSKSVSIVTVSDISQSQAKIPIEKLHGTNVDDVTTDITPLVNGVNAEPEKDSQNDNSATTTKGGNTEHHIIPFEIPKACEDANEKKPPAVNSSLDSETSQTSEGLATHKLVDGQKSSISSEQLSPSGREMSQKCTGHNENAGLQNIIPSAGSLQQQNQTKDKPNTIQSKCNMKSLLKDGLLVSEAKLSVHREQDRKKLSHKLLLKDSVQLSEKTVTSAEHDYFTPWSAELEKDKCKEIFRPMSTDRSVCESKDSYLAGPFIVPQPHSTRGIPVLVRVPVPKSTAVSSNRTLIKDMLSSPMVSLKPALSLHNQTMSGTAERAAAISSTSTSADAAEKSLNVVLLSKLQIPNQSPKAITSSKLKIPNHHSSISSKESLNTTTCSLMTSTSVSYFKDAVAAQNITGPAQKMFPLSSSKYIPVCSTFTSDTRRGSASAAVPNVVASSARNCNLISPALSDGGGGGSANVANSSNGDRVIITSTHKKDKLVVAVLTGVSSGNKYPLNTLHLASSTTMNVSPQGTQATHKPLPYVKPSASLHIPSNQNFQFQSRKLPTVYPKGRVILPAKGSSTPSAQQAVVKSSDGLSKKIILPQPVLTSDDSSRSNAAPLTNSLNMQAAGSQNSSHRRQRQTSLVLNQPFPVGDGSVMEKRSAQLPVGAAFTVPNHPSSEILLLQSSVKSNLEPVAYRMPAKRTSSSNNPVVTKDTVVTVVHSQKKSHSSNISESSGVCTNLIKYLARKSTSGKLETPQSLLSGKYYRMQRPQKSPKASGKLETQTVGGSQSLLSNKYYKLSCPNKIRADSPSLAKLDVVPSKPSIFATTIRTGQGSVPVMIVNPNVEEDILATDIVQEVKRDARISTVHRVGQVRQEFHEDKVNTNMKNCSSQVLHPDEVFKISAENSVLQLTPEDDDESDSDIDISNTEEQDLSILTQLLVSAGAGRPEENLIKETQGFCDISVTKDQQCRDTILSKANSHMLPKTISDENQQDLNLLHNVKVSENHNEEGCFGIKIESVYSLSDGSDLGDSVLPKENDKSELVHNVHLLMLKDNDKSELVYNVHRSNVMKTCFVVLERLAKTLPGKTISAQSRCSEHCRKRTLDYLCNLNLLDCVNHQDSAHFSMPKKVKIDQETSQTESLRNTANFSFKSESRQDISPPFHVLTKESSCLPNSSSIQAKAPSNSCSDGLSQKVICLAEMSQKKKSEQPDTVKEFFPDQKESQRESIPNPESAKASPELHNVNKLLKNLHTQVTNKRIQMTESKLSRKREEIEKIRKIGISGAKSSDPSNMSQWIRQALKGSLKKDDVKIPVQTDPPVQSPCASVLLSQQQNTDSNVVNAIEPKIVQLVNNNQTAPRKSVVPPKLQASSTKQTLVFTVANTSPETLTFSKAQASTSTSSTASLSSDGTNVPSEKVTDALKSLASYLAATGRKVTEGNAQYFLLKIDNQHLLVKVPTSESRSLTTVASTISKVSAQSKDGTVWSLKATGPALNSEYSLANEKSLSQITSTVPVTLSKQGAPVQSQGSVMAHQVSKSNQFAQPASSHTSGGALISNQTGSSATASILSHLPPNSTLLPERKAKRCTLTEEERKAKRKKLEAKYPLPPGVIIKTETDDPEYDVNTTGSSCHMSSTSTTLSTLVNQDQQNLDTQEFRGSPIICRLDGTGQLVQSRKKDKVSEQRHIASCLENPGSNKTPHCPTQMFNTSGSSLLEDSATEFEQTLLSESFQEMDEPPSLIEEKLKEDCQNTRNTGSSDSDEEMPPTLQPMFTAPSSVSFTSENTARLADKLNTESTVKGEVALTSSTYFSMDSGSSSGHHIASNSLAAITEVPESSKSLDSLTSKNRKIQQLKDLLRKKEMEVENMKKRLFQQPILNTGTD